MLSRPGVRAALSEVFAAVIGRRASDGRGARCPWRGEGASRSTWDLSCAGRGALEPNRPDPAPRTRVQAIPRGIAGGALPRERRLAIVLGSEARLARRTRRATARAATIPPDAPSLRLS